MAKLECRNVTFSWDGHRGNSVEALQDVSFQADAGQILGVIGPSGSGKSSLLQILAGLERPLHGQVLLDNNPIQAPTQRIGMVFQDPLLFPWLSVLKNVEFGHKMQGTPAALRRQLAEDILSKVGMQKWCHRYPHELSGGMKQRVAIARALMNDPEVVLMDEPFAALDFQTRLLMGHFVLDVWRQFRKTIIFVTHSIDEVIALSHRVLVMTASPGRIREAVDIRLPHPRDLASDECNEYRVLFMRHIEAEVMASFSTSVPPPTNGEESPGRVDRRETFGQSTAREACH